ncbi:MAG: hypothetical protein IJ912_03120 [Fibrobacter sp.]|nr:hypothetical protein [Fibrobacter sp.]
MGFFFWFLCSILVVALVLLLFPFSVWIDFEAGERSARALFFFFKKKVYEYEKKWGKGGDDKCVDRESRPSSLGHDRDQHLGQERSDCPKTKEERGAGLDERLETKDGEGEGKEAKDDSDGDVILEPKAIESTKTDLAEVAKPAISCHPEQSFSTNGRESIQFQPKDLECLDERRKTIDDRGDDVVVEAKAPAAPKEELKAAPAESKVDEAKKDKPKVLASKPIEVKSSKSAKPESEKKEKPKKEKPKLTDREFWTILLTPDLDARAFKYALKIIAAVFSLFRIRFSDCFVEGIRSDYVSMGYIAALNGILKAYPFVGDWDLRMDWLHEKELRASGNVRLSITLLRIFCFVLETLVLAGILAFIFWRRRAHVLKTKELPEIGFIRKKIVDFILED